MELFIRHLIYDVLAKKTIDKVLKLIRKLDWSDSNVQRILFKIFTKPWKIKFGDISLLAMLSYDLNRYHPGFSVSVVDQVLEDVRLGLENNIYNANQRRVATVKYLGELYSQLPSLMFFRSVKYIQRPPSPDLPAACSLSWTQA
jgi:regulator of nonsense transcripts 2